MSGGESSHGLLCLWEDKSCFIVWIRIFGSQYPYHTFYRDNYCLLSKSMSSQVSSTTNRIPCEYCNGTGQISFFGGVSRFSISYEECLECAGLGYIPQDPTSLKDQILLHIYETFEEWSAQQPWACAKGCSYCCSQNVTITEQEGRRILHHLQLEGKGEWLANRLQQLAPVRSSLTNNEYAAAFLAGNDSSNQPPGAHQPCPFLENNCCTIYSVRPFSCRCFLSTVKCSPKSAAVVDPHCLSANFALTQLLEHLDQNRLWGNLLDILHALLVKPEFETTATHFKEQSTLLQAYSHTRKCRPLPGFLIPPEEQPKLQSLLDKIFTAQFNGITVEAYLNGQ